MGLRKMWCGSSQLIELLKTDYQEEIKAQKDSKLNDLLNVTSTIVDILC